MIAGPAECARSSALALAALTYGGVALAQTPSEEGDRINPLIVLVTCTSAEVQSNGAGLVLGADADRVWIATAAHVIQACTDSVQVRFNGVSRRYSATVVPQATQPLDLAALSVTSVPAAVLRAIPFDRLGDPSTLKRGDGLYLVGNPAGAGWTATESSDRMDRIAGDTLFFTSSNIAEGYSGGALLNDRWEVVGMIMADSRTGSRALSIGKVLKVARGWRVPVTLRPPFSRLSAGDMRTCAASASGSTSCWGNIQFEQPGIFDSTLTLGNVRFKSISVGLFHACGVAFNGAAYCIGLNNYGQLGNGSTTTSEETPVPVRSGLNFASISAGGWHTCALTPDGTAYCWGAGEGGRLGNDAGVDSHDPLPVAGGQSFASISSGLRNTCAVTRDGAAYCWGGMQGSGLERGGADPPNAFVPLRIGGKMTFKSVSSGYEFGCGVGADGAGYCWGINEEGVLGNGSDKTGITEQGLTPVLVAGGHKFASISAGLSGHACGVSTTGGAFCWGMNDEGQLGNDSKVNSKAPVAVAGGLRFASISVGHFHTCGVATDGAIYCWGATGSMGMGTGTTTGSTRPVKYK